jgi:putative sigma-54 modulation protein
MNVTVTGRHMEMTDALKAHIDAALAKLEGHFDKIIDVDVILDVQKNQHKAEINLHANGLHINSKEVSEDMYASLDAVVAKLDKRVRKFKDRINRHQPRTAREARDYNHAILTVDQPVEEGDAPQDTHREVHREKITMKPLSVDEAVMQLELVHEPFLVFQNADTARVNFLYSRDDGTYSLIEPQF